MPPRTPPLGARRKVSETMGGAPGSPATGALREKRCRKNPWPPRCADSLRMPRPRYQQNHLQRPLHGRGMHMYTRARMCLMYDKQMIAFK